MKLFHLDEQYNVIWEPQALLLAPFKALFTRDRTKGKTKAINEMAFVWFFADIKSDYHIHTDLEKRTEVIRADLKGLPNNWKPDDKVKEAIEFYEKNSGSVTANILKDSSYVANKLSRQMRNAVDNDEDLDVAEITKLLEGVKKMPEVIKALQTAEKAVLKEIKESQDNIGAKEKALFEDGGLKLD